MKLKNRRPCVTFENGPFIVTVGFDPVTGHPCEFFFVGRGKAGQQLWETLGDIGVEGSRIMQGRFDL